MVDDPCVPVVRMADYSAQSGSVLPDDCRERAECLELAGFLGADFRLEADFRRAAFRADLRARSAPDFPWPRLEWQVFPAALASRQVLRRRRSRVAKPASAAARSAVPDVPRALAVSLQKEPAAVVPAPLPPLGDSPQPGVGRRHD
jgi:hypothetical protein